jgi:hypothetical protein
VATAITPLLTMILILILAAMWRVERRQTEARKLFVRIDGPYQTVSERRMHAPIP